ncbi:hypothetical protein D7147_02965 [Micromonospora musae]|uniref:Uncharacterized protein n=1 Tax=Micromonospora musae TaxID=1894970 RepID=A0A3A9Y4U9_9ACTN|nr:hypothetical protein [Micromonospora musae]RKN23990.1 hypothetical protein D7147_02965 [Micromonospora musae]RKN31693.1 hypothetical protein D7044_15440 [Micromonospora musae]
MAHLQVDDATRNIRPMARTNDDDRESLFPTVGAGTADTFRVEFTPTSRDKRFGVFQLYIEGIPIGDASTTALYPHIANLSRLCQIAEHRSKRGRGRLHLGDTFDHLDMSVEMSQSAVLFTFSTRPRSEWGEPPPWAPPVGEEMRLSVARSEFISIWRQAEPRFRLDCLD